MKAVFKVALIALLWIIVISSGKVSGDSLPRLQMAHAWWTGTPEVTYNPQEPPKSRLDIPGVLGVGGKRYSAYDVGQPLLMLPADWLGSQLHQVFPKQDELFLRRVTVSIFTFIPLNVATILASFWLLSS
jgi:hypothetical protein